MNSPRTDMSLASLEKTASSTLWFVSFFLKLIQFTFKHLLIWNLIFTLYYPVPVCICRQLLPLLSPCSVTYAYPVMLVFLLSQCLQLPLLDCSFLMSTFLSFAFLPGTRLRWLTLSSPGSCAKCWATTISCMRWGFPQSPIRVFTKAPRIQEKHTLWMRKQREGEGDNGHRELVPCPENAPVRGTLWSTGKYHWQHGGALPIFCLKLLKATELILRMKNGLYSFLRLDL